MADAHKNVSHGVTPGPSLPSLPLGWRGADRDAAAVRSDALGLQRKLRVPPGLSHYTEEKVREEPLDINTHALPAVSWDVLGHSATLPPRSHEGDRGEGVVGALWPASALGHSGCLSRTSEPDHQGTCRLCSNSEPARAWLCPLYSFSFFQETLG